MYLKAIVSALIILGPVAADTALAQAPAPSENRIYRSLQRPPNAVTPDGYGVYSMDEVIQDRSLRHSAPSFDVRTINFAFGSAVIPLSERWKVEPLARVIHRFVRRNPGERFLLEGHTDSVGTPFANRELSQARADSLKATLMHYFRVPPFAVTAVGYGASEPVVNVSGPEVKNRRVTLRRVTGLVTPGETNIVRYSPPQRNKRKSVARQPKQYRYKNLANPPVPDIKPEADVALAVPQTSQSPEQPSYAPKSKPNAVKNPGPVAPETGSPEKEIRKIPIVPKQQDDAAPVEPIHPQKTTEDDDPYIDL
ncbi:MAG: OmpA family protein [Stappiaceae bacterium]